MSEPIPNFVEVQEAENKVTSKAYELIQSIVAEQPEIRLHDAVEEVAKKLEPEVGEITDRYHYLIH